MNKAETSTKSTAKSAAKGVRKASTAAAKAPAKAPAKARTSKPAAPKAVAVKETKGAKAPAAKPAAKAPAAKPAAKAPRATKAAAPATPVESVVAEDNTNNLIPATPPSASSARRRSAVVPPAVITSEMSLHDYLMACTPPLATKIIDIALAQTQVAPDLRDDAAQEIRMIWHQTKPDIKKYQPGQIASYAHRMARHAALHTRRELGSAVRLPGSAFRKRKDGSSYVTPGVLAAALDWNELESWLQADDMADAHMAGVSAMQSFDALIDNPDSSVEAVEALEQARDDERLAQIEQCRTKMTERQYDVMRLLVEGKSFEDILAIVGIKKGILMREVAVASSLLCELEDN